MKNVLANARTHVKTVTGKAAVVSAALVATTATALASDASSGSSAAVSAMQSMQSQATEMIGAAWPIATTILGALVGIKLFKKFTSRAS